MKIYLESNFVLLGIPDEASIDIEGAQASLREILEVLSGRSSHPLQFLQRDGRRLAPGWEVRINGQPLEDHEDGPGTILKDGDTVSIKLELLAGG
jgi:hypothetical protein